MNAHPVRKATFAGSWYPARASECERQIKAFIKHDSSQTDPQMRPVGGIVPHAGWYFSGAIACGVFHSLKREAVEEPDVFLIFGMHLHPQAPSCMMAEGAWETPFGNLDVDRELAEKVGGEQQFVIETTTDFTPDNTIELQLPFVKYFFQNAKVLTMGVAPDAAAPGVGAAAVDAAKALGRKVMVIGSTDLTHYGANYGFVSKGSGPEALDWVREKNDRRVIEAMQQMNAENVVQIARNHQNACCAGAVAAAIAAANQLGANQSRTTAYATSHDKSPGDSFVGYVGMVFGIG